MKLTFNLILILVIIALASHSYHAKQNILEKTGLIDSLYVQCKVCTEQNVALQSLNDSLRKQRIAEQALIQQYESMLKASYKNYEKISQEIQSQVKTLVQSIDATE